MFDYMKLSVYF